MLGVFDMPKCPKCGKEIDYLRDFFPIWQEYKMTIDENGNAYYELVDDSLLTNSGDEYKCPKCSAVLFRDEKEAVKFLRGETLQKGV